MWTGPLVPSERARLIEDATQLAAHGARRDHLDGPGVTPGLLDPAALFGRDPLDLGALGLALLGPTALGLHGRVCDRRAHVQGRRPGLRWQVKWQLSSMAVSWG